MFQGLSRHPCSATLLTYPVEWSPVQCGKYYFSQENNKVLYSLLGNKSTRYGLPLPQNKINALRLLLTVKRNAHY